MADKDNFQKGYDQGYKEGRAGEPDPKPGPSHIIDFVNPKEQQAWEDGRDKGWRDGQASGGGGGDDCFIATATYGSPMAQEVEFLRSFRDKYLIRYIFGRKLVYWYYHLSPSVVPIIEKSTMVRKLALAFLTPIVCLVKRLVKNR